MFKSQNNQREVSSYGRGGGRGRGRERGRGRGFGRNQYGRGRGRGRYSYNRRPTNTPQEIIVEGKTLYPTKTYTPDEYNALSNSQKDKLREARTGQYSEPFTTRSISAAVIQGIREAWAPNDDFSSVTYVNNVPPGLPPSIPHETPNTESRSGNSNVRYNVSSSQSTSTDQFRSRRRRP